MARFWTADKTYGLSGEIRHKDRVMPGLYKRPTSARNVNTNGMSMPCALKSHKSCPKKWAGKCTCPCHKPKEPIQ